jgi:hypothetical protein
MNWIWIAPAIGAPIIVVKVICLICWTLIRRKMIHLMARRRKCVT